MIDFVVTWVDGSDEEWLNLKNKYSPNPSKCYLAQYRDWGVLKYWFRAVEKYAPWVNNIYFVTCGQIPSWLNTEHKKIKIINHTDFIPEEYLPTFSSHTIELNLHRIPHLSETFVYFNDDMYLASPVDSLYFFKDGMPCHSPIFSALTPSIPNDPFVHYLCNNLSIVNKYFNKKNVIRNNPLKWFNTKYGKLNAKNIYYSLTGKFTGFTNFHQPSPMLKSVFEEVWEREYDLLHNTCKNKFRSLADVNQYVITQYAICSGKFEPANVNDTVFLTMGTDNDKISSVFNSKKYKTVCINDNPNENQIDFEKDKAFLNSVFKKAFPQKSEFEK